MSGTILEQLRSNQEDTEFLERAIVKSLFLKSDNPRNQLVADLMIKHLLDEILKRSSRALALYNDSDGLKRQEIRQLEGSLCTSDDKSTNNPAIDVWTNYYDSVNQIKEYHGRFTQYGQPEEIHDENWQFLHALDDKAAFPKFTGQEGFGRFVDLHEYYNQFFNLGKVRESRPEVLRRLDYVTYLNTFDQFHDIPIRAKDAAYQRYLKDLLNYLKSFFARTQPLLSVTQIEERHLEEFKERWEERKIRGWESVPTAEGLGRNPLFCLPCQKLFTNRAVYKAHKTGKKHQRNREKIAELLEKPPSLLEDYREVAQMECFISRLKETLGDVIQDTMNNVRKRQTRTATELEAEMFDSDDEDPMLLPIEEIKRRAEKKQKAESDSSDEEKPLYNPLNLPIGWDGKPIPYWLYKLHGLGVEFKCEICGNYSYWGRRAFERHFQEWRHAYGMRCLKVPNTLHFKEITSISEVLDRKRYVVYRKLQDGHQLELFRPDVEEEFEDTQGNVMTKRAYDDLKRQGLL